MFPKRYNGMKIKESLRVGRRFLILETINQPLW
jgi:hypothetical protein